MIATIETEVWKDIEGYEGYFQISNKRRIKSLERYCRGKGGSSRLVKEKILTPQKNDKGYEVITLSKDATRKIFALNTLFHRAFTQ